MPNSASVLSSFPNTFALQNSRLGQYSSRLAQSAFFCLWNQVLAVVLRPKKDAKVRPLWNQYHHWVGRSAIVLAIVNVYIGLHLYNAGTAWETAYTIVWVAVLALYAALEIYWRLRGPWSKSYSDKSTIAVVSSAVNLGSSGANPVSVGQTNPALSTPGGKVI